MTHRLRTSCSWCIYCCVIFFHFLIIDLTATPREAQWHGNPPLPGAFQLLFCDAAWRFFSSWSSTVLTHLCYNQLKVLDQTKAVMPLTTKRLQQWWSWSFMLKGVNTYEKYIKLIFNIDKYSLFGVKCWAVIMLIKSDCNSLLMQKWHASPLNCCFAGFKS